MMHWSARWVGTPWLDRGRTSAGCDCWGLARLVYEAELGIRLPSYLEAYPSAEESAEIDGLVRDALWSGPWVEVPAPREFDLALFAVGRWDAHIGIVIDRGRMLHMAMGDHAKIERLDAPIWQRRRRGTWRHREVFAPHTR